MRGPRWLGAAVLAMAAGASHAGQPAPRVVLVQPSSPEIPANLLRISIEFAAPVEGPVLARIALARAAERRWRHRFSSKSSGHQTQRS